MTNKGDATVCLGRNRKAVLEISVVVEVAR